ncbi:hypothetical protein GOP47_0012442 [Adiantum capillus-veneris]|uniref:Uncharacterized protein n=1 Tax=Adiantum capillus-veneris TaxID=13818 RepID=A0A9D4UQX6_ADICA|nr:hypothetical protein GOP47_0012442 [Adiantum capillus-veneris]
MLLAILAFLHEFLHNFLIQRVFKMLKNPWALVVKVGLGMFGDCQILFWRELSHATVILSSDIFLDAV